MSTPTFGPDDSLETVFRIKNAHEAELLKILLGEHGIPCQLDGDLQAGFSGTFDIGIITTAKDAERARAILAEHTEPLSRSQDPPENASD